jgi:hypothetical protein
MGMNGRRIHGDGPQPHSRWRYGDRDPSATAGHNADSRTYRQRLAAEAFPPGARRRVVDRVAAGTGLAEAATEVGVTWQAVRAWSSRDPEFFGQLDEACRAAAPPGTEHGTAGGYRHARCRCSRCRAAHHRTNS